MIIGGIMKKIKTIMLFFCIVLVLIVDLSIVTVTFTNLNIFRDFSLNTVKSARMQGYDDSVKFQIQNVISLLNTIYDEEKSGALTREQAQAEAITLIKGLRYGDDNSGYFWIDDTNYILVAHPILPQNEGQNRYNLEDKNGVMIIQEIMKVVKNNSEGGFSEFYFTKADGVTVSPKRTYSMLFTPWNWIISSGNYYDDINIEMDAIEQDANDKFLTLYIAVVITTIIIMVVAIVIAIVFANRFSKPIIETGDMLEKMANGNLTLKLEDKGNKTEIGVMRKNVNAFAGSMNKMITTSKQNIESLNKVAVDLNHSSEDISNEIKQISNNSTKLADNAKVQQTTVSDAVTSMNEMSQIVENLTSQIRDQNDSISQSSAAIEEMVSNIYSITQNIDKFGNSFESLSKNSLSGKTAMKNVAELIKVVSEESSKLQETNKIIETVAQQTNLLAMNAAIEAAHAGDAGKGFSVVAQEIRKLSENTTKQSHMIKETLTKVTEKIQAVNEASDTAGMVFDGIADQISNDDKLINEIRASMEEQSSGSKQIVDSLSDMKNSAHIIMESSGRMNDEISSVVAQVSQMEIISTEIQRSTQDIQTSSKVISNNSEGLMTMAGKNRNLAESLSEETDKYTV